MAVHHLYSFRRCPYAMRARMGLVQSGVAFEKTEVDLKNKPQDMLDLSPKGTVPVLKCAEGAVLDESLDIMLWALRQNDPDDWLGGDLDAALALIALNDGEFKACLDRYKYPARYPDEDCSGARDDGFAFLKDLNDRIARNGALCGDKTGLADIAVFPFVRQFAHVDRDWFYDHKEIPALQAWLAAHLDSDLFKNIMRKS